MKKEGVSPHDLEKSLNQRDFSQVKDLALARFRETMPDRHSPDNHMASCYTHGVLILLASKGYELVKKETK